MAAANSWARMSAAARDRRSCAAARPDPIGLAGPRRAGGKPYSGAVADDPREALLAVARDMIDKKGYLGLSLRTVAAAAGVTPEVARRYYRNRDQLFAAALRLPVDPTTAIPTLVAPGVEGMGERLVRFMLDVLKDPEARDELVSLARAGVNAGHAAAGLQDFLERGVVDRIAGIIGVPDARMRAALITSYLLGIAMTRYGVRLDPLSSASEEEVIRMVAPVVQDLLDPRKPVPGRARQHDAQQAEHTRARRTFVADPKAHGAAQSARHPAHAKPSEVDEQSGPPSGGRAGSAGRAGSGGSPPPPPRPAKPTPPPAPGKRARPTTAARSTPAERTEPVDPAPSAGAPGSGRTAGSAGSASTRGSGAPGPGREGDPAPGPAPRDPDDPAPPAPDASDG